MINMKVLDIEKHLKKAGGYNGQKQYDNNKDEDNCSGINVNNWSFNQN